ncbi:hypothetical protein ACFL7E_03470 [Thermodesulfobacteriota bacterium]
MGSTKVTGINSVDIVPDFNSPSVVKRLRDTISQSSALRAAVAYWTIESDKISKDLPLKLSGEGFLCVDINYPTDIDELNRLSARGGNIYLHLLKPNPQPGEFRIKMPPHLMHVKTLLFDLDENSAELWVGSHNWTARALSGLNIEASNVIRMKIACNLYRDAEILLNSIRTSCVLFDPGLVDYYKWLQGQNIEDVDWIVDLQSTNAGGMTGERITLFMNAKSDFQSLKKVDKVIKLAVKDVSSGQVHLYDGQVKDTGHVKGSGLDYDNRLYAFHSGRARPEIEGPAVPPAAKIKKSQYWATVTVEAGAPSLLPVFEHSDFFGLSAYDRWLIMAQDPFEKRVDSDDRQLFQKSNKPLILRPVTVDAFHGKQPKDFELKHLETKKLGDRPLIRKAVVPRGEK